MQRIKLAAKAGVAKFLGGCFSLLRVARRNGDPGSSLGEAVRHCQAEAAIAAGNDRHATGKIKRVQVGFLFAEKDCGRDAGFAAWPGRVQPRKAALIASTPPPDFAALLPVVVASGDDLATEILRAAGKELARIASIVSLHLFQNEASVPVAMIGGVFRHAKLAREIFYNELRRLDSRAEVKEQVVDPVEGALRLARSNSSKIRSPHPPLFGVDEH